MEPSFVPGVIDEMMKIPDLDSIAAIHWLEKRLGRKAGGSTGTNLWGALTIAERMLNQGEKGSIVTLMCDGGERYLDTCYNPEWIEQEFGSLAQPTEWLDSFL